jgi:endonuclease III
MADQPLSPTNADLCAEAMRHGATLSDRNQGEDKLMASVFATLVDRIERMEAEAAAQQERLNDMITVIDDWRYYAKKLDGRIKCACAILVDSAPEAKQ